MSTEAIGGLAIQDRLAPRRRGFVDRFLAAVNRLPGPAVLAWAGIGIGIGLVAHLIVWIASDRPFGQIYHDLATPGLIFAWFGWLLHTLNSVGARTFDDFRPALADPESEDRYRYELTTIPDFLAVLAGIGAIIVVSVGFYVFVLPYRSDPVIPEIDLVAQPIWALMSIALGIVVLHSVRQMRVIGRLSWAARNVDIFKPAPLNSFARLTAVGALGLIAFVVAFMLYSPDQPIAYVVQEIGVLALAVGFFVLPLRVMHSRLAAEKERLMGANQDRIKSVLDRIHVAVDSDDISESERLNHALTAVLAERDVIARLHTWPWSAGTFRGFASALLLPIALIVFTQVIDRLL